MGYRMRKVTIYSRMGCHLCEVAHQTLTGLRAQVDFELVEVFIDGSSELTELYGEQVPVIHIDDKPHDFFRVNPERFLAAIAQG